MAACDAPATDEPKTGQNQQDVTTSGNTTSVRFKGTEANASFHDATTDVFIDMFEDVSGSNGGGTVDEAFLFYSVTTVNSGGGFTVESGSGDIPPTSAQISGGSGHVSV